MISVLGTYECKVDAKGRFMFPVQFKNQMGEATKSGFVVKRSIFKKCLELLSIEQWHVETAKISKLNMFNRKNSEFVTKFMAGVKPAELDGTGRLLIPKDLLRYGEISKEIVLTSVINRIEIWDKTLYEAAIDYDEEDFAVLTEDVLGESETE